MKAKYRYPKSRINLKKSIIESVSRRIMANKGTRIKKSVALAIGWCVAYDIVPKIRNNYRRRKKVSK